MRSIKHHITNNPLSILVIALPLSLLIVYLIVSTVFFILPRM